MPYRDVSSNIMQRICFHLEVDKYLEEGYQFRTKGSLDPTSLLSALKPGNWGTFEKKMH